MVNWDNILAYDTVKIVRVQDFRLGLLYYIIQFLIVCYVIFQILVFQEYLVVYSPYGNVRLSLKQPSDLEDSDLLPYCLRHSEYDKHGIKNLECLYWDEDLVLYPVLESNDMLITSRVTITEQYLPGCNLTDASCHFVSNYTTRESFYISEVEKFTVLIDHGFFTPYIQRNAIELNGKIVDQNGDEMDVNGSVTQIGVIGQPDIIEVGDLLKAAGVESLDEVSDLSDSETLRYSGPVLIVKISYSNKVTYDTTVVEYTISVNKLEKTEFKAVQPIFSKKIENGRILWNRHGVRLLFEQVGEIGQFDFQTLLLTFITGLGLASLTSVVVDIVATKLCPARKTVSSHKYEPVAGRKTINLDIQSDDEGKRYTLREE
eukprot:TRINITY_DN10859_c0_g1_i1.p1 TRINITY_DN10859_c0_g1~~TRINITY_DN10859_c0_g1_i1.p1  ORF type:complete len:392 (-),score=55.43 TRINITY_DN10859_c0_g1_i1:12-1133(-)